MELAQTLQSLRRELLDLTPRNRLIHTPRHVTRGKLLEVVDELSDEIYRLLVLENRTLSFLPAPEQEESEAATPWAPPEEEDEEPAEELEEGEVAPRHRDRKLQTELPEGVLQKKLLNLFYDARTYEQEHGVNVLYLGLGYLRWREAEASSRDRFAPLILVPVRLERRSVGGEIRLQRHDDEIGTNLSLQEMLLEDFGLRLPALPDEEELLPSEYCAEVAEAVAARPDWEVAGNDMVLSFFGFSKFLMFLDLDPARWPDHSRLEEHPILKPLLGDGFDETDDPWPEDEPLDGRIDPSEVGHVLDADSSQAVAIERVWRGQSMTIQGPPGTGKSQTIANLIARGVLEGKRVLFVAEKVAALEVVHRRLASLGLAGMCLELHSRRANKKALLEELRRTLEAPRVRKRSPAATASDLRAARDRLNAHAEALHGRLAPTRLTAYEVFGHTIRLLSEEAPSAPGVDMQRALVWDTDRFERARTVLADVGDRLQKEGPVDAHPWRGVGREAFLALDRRTLDDRIRALEEDIGAVRAAASAMEELLDVPPAPDAAALRMRAAAARAISGVPPADLAALASARWQTDQRALRAAVDAGTELARTRVMLREVMREEAWERDPAPIAVALRRRRTPLWRALFPSWRRAKRDYLELTNGSVRFGLDAALAHLDQLERGRRARGDVVRAEEAASSAFGDRWRGDESDWESLRALVEWVDTVADRAGDLPFPAVLARVPNPAELTPMADAAEEKLDRALASFDALTQFLQLDLQVAFGVDAHLRVPFEALGQRLADWRAHPERIEPWIQLHRRLEELRPDLQDLVELLECGRLAPDRAVPALELAYYRAWTEEILSRHPDLATFEGGAHQKVQDEFRKLDCKRIDLAAREVAAVHWASLPRAQGGGGEVAVLRHEMQKKRRHLPIRRLLERAGGAVQQIKPVFMMSPLSVAQFLAPGKLEFDLLLVDEASQVPPVDALGAIARARQVVVVGDDKQLPPTQFFDRGLGDGDPAEEREELDARELESVLGLCTSKGMSSTMLRWHYRSRHESLITVSNREFYENRLFVFPSPAADTPELGLQFRFVEDGVYDRGGSHANRAEARIVAEAAIEHARSTPELSLGIGTFSVAQRDAVLDELELLWRENRDVRAFFSTDNEDAFFVKNLENIQGDERDVIFISVGYGPDADGFVAMNFGPVGGQGGERRLNVLMTRARQRCVCFSSIRATDIDLDRARSRGAAVLRTFLEYAEHRRLDLGERSEREPDSPFEREVKRALEAHGWRIVPQVGVAGFYIDLAVVDPDAPGRYLLGIECDGANYHSSRWSRDRDRLRQEVLEGRGWSIHRIWSTDWFKDPQSELRRTLARIEQAHADALRSFPQEAPVEEAEPEPVAEVAEAEGEVQAENEVETEPDPEPARDESAADEPAPELAPESREVPYACADFDVPKQRDPHELEPDEMCGIVARIVELEAPVHEDEIARRVTALWGMSRTGKRIQEAVRSGLDALAVSGEGVAQGGFWRPAGFEMEQVRDRSDASSSLRDPERLPPDEVALAVRIVLAESVAAERDEVVRLVCRKLGFQRSTESLRAVVDRVVEGQVEDGTVQLRETRLSLAREDQAPSP